MPLFKKNWLGVVSPVPPLSPFDLPDAYAYEYELCFTCTQYIPAAVASV